jgi:hypothetical protein
VWDITTEKEGKEQMKRNIEVKYSFKKLKINIHSIRLKLILIFLVPVACLITLGFISYWFASKGLIENYETNTRVSLDMMSEYYELGLDNISGKAIQLVTDETIQNYYSQYYSGNGAEEAGRRLRRAGMRHLHRGGHRRRRANRAGPYTVRRRGRCRSTRR